MADEGTTAPAGVQADSHANPTNEGVAEAKASPPTAPDAQGEAAPKRLLGLPIAAWVAGGTTSSKHDAWMAAYKQDMKERQDLYDAESQLGSIPTEEGGAKLYKHTMGDSRVPIAHVHLQYINSKKEVVYDSVGDVIVPAATPDDMILALFCPRCLESGHKAAALCIIHIRQSNRKWFLDQRTQGEVFVVDGEPFHSAGIIMDGEPFHCPDCSWHAAIHKNLVYTIG